MAITNYPNGIGGSLGSSLATCKPLQTSGNVWYVSSSSGVDAASPAGQNREKPLLTLTQAITNSTAGDIIVLMSGSSIAIAAATALAGRALIGEGEAGGIPTAELTFSSVGTVTQAAVGGEVRNIRFRARSGTSGGLAKLSLTASNQLVEDCYFDCDQYDDAQALGVVGALANVVVRGCTFVSTATSTAAQPFNALDTSGACTDFVLEDCVFDAGAAGFSNYWALDLSAAAITRLRGEGLSFLRGADYRIHASTTGKFNPQVTSGGVRGTW